MLCKDCAEEAVLKCDECHEFFCKDHGNRHEQQLGEEHRVFYLFAELQGPGA